MYMLKQVTDLHDVKSHGNHFPKEMKCDMESFIPSKMFENTLEMIPKCLNLFRQSLDMNLKIRKKFDASRNGSSRFRVKRFKRTYEVEYSSEFFEVRIFRILIPISFIEK
jgi:hypothetical protein